MSPITATRQWHAKLQALPKADKIIEIAAIIDTIPVGYSGWITTLFEKPVFVLNFDFSEMFGYEEAQGLIPLRNNEDVLEYLAA